jgi:TolB protein
MKGSIPIRCAAIFLLLFCVILFGTRFTRAQTTITGTTRQLTTNSSPQLDPAISGDLVVYTDQRNGNDDVYFINVVTGVETQITSATTPQRLNDVSGNLIAFTDLTSPGRRVMLYDVTTATTSQAGTGTVDQNPRLDGDLVAFERGLSAAADVVAFDRATNTEIPIATTAAIEISPVVGGTRIVYERHAALAGQGDIVMFDTATSTETVLEGTTADARRPDIDGNIVVWDVLSASGDTDIAIYDLSTGLTKVLTRSGDQRAPHVSGRVVAFDDNALTVNSDIVLYHIPSEQFVPVAVSGDIGFLNDISGNRIVYTSNQAGNNDIWLCEFTLDPAVEVAPSSIQFGSVNVATSQTQLVTVANLDNHALSVQASLDLAGGGFSVSPSSQSVPVAGSIDISVTFAPLTAGPASNTLRITTGSGQFQVSLAGLGVATSVPPQQQIADILAFFDASAQQGSLTGNGSGNSGAGRRNALRNLLEAAGDLIQQGRITDACRQLQDALDRTDGNPRPPDFVTGPAASELAERIRALRTALGC